MRGRRAPPGARDPAAASPSAPARRQPLLCGYCAVLPPVDAPRRVCQRDKGRPPGSVAAAPAQPLVVGSPQPIRPASALPVSTARVGGGPYPSCKGSCNYQPPFPPSPPSTLSSPSYPVRSSSLAVCEAVEQGKRGNHFPTRSGEPSLSPASPISGVNSPPHHCPAASSPRPRVISPSSHHLTQSPLPPPAPSSPLFVSCRRRGPPALPRSTAPSASGAATRPTSHTLEVATPPPNADGTPHQPPTAPSANATSAGATPSNSCLRLPLLVGHCLANQLPLSSWRRVPGAPNAGGLVGAAVTIPLVPKQGVAGCPPRVWGSTARCARALPRYHRRQRESLRGHAPSATWQR